MTLVQIFVLAIVCSLGHAALVQLDEDSTEDFNEIVKKELSFKILPVLNQVNNISSQLGAQCQQAINRMRPQCHNAPHFKSCEDLLDKLMKRILEHPEKIMVILKTLIDSLPHLEETLGDSTKQFVEELQTVIKNVANSIVEGAKDLMEGTAEELQNAAKSLVDMADHLGSSLESFSSDFFDDIADPIGDIGGGIEEIIGGVEGIVDDVADAFSDLGGWGKRRRRRRRSVCPICNNTESLSIEEIEERVCGSEYHEKIQSVQKKMDLLNRTISSYTALNIIKKVEYDNTFIDLSQGVVFHTVFITYNLGTDVRYQSNASLQMPIMDATAANVTEEIFNFYLTSLQMTHVSINAPQKISNVVLASRSVKNNASVKTDISKNCLLNMAFVVILLIVYI